VALSRTLPDGLYFPCGFGFIPRTEGEDGDPLDMALLSGANAAGPLIAGCLVTARLLGEIRAEQIEARKRIRNDRFLGVPVTSVNKPPQRDIGDIDKSAVASLEHFFATYNQLQGRTFRLLGRGGAAQARRALERGIKP
jgi:inorganic pyrophosphatase